MVSLEHDGPRQLAVFRLLDRPAHGGELFWGGARGQDAGLVPRQPRKDRRHLFRGLTFGQHHLGEAGAQRTVVVYLGEIQVFEWQVPQAGDGIVRRELPPAHVLEEFADRVRIQGSNQHSAVS